DRDLVREVLVGLPEPEQVGVVRILVLDDHGDVLERFGQVRGQLVQRPPHVLLEPHRSRSGARTWKRRTVSTPKRKPPTWAPKAVPPPLSGCVSERFADRSW